MKTTIQRFLISAAVLLTAFMSSTATAEAADYYGIIIGGVKVTSDNCSNVTGGGIATTTGGKISYDYSRNILTLKGANVDCQKHNAINITSAVPFGLRIVLEDDNYFHNINGVALAIYHPSGSTNYSSPSRYIEGSGTLTFQKGVIATFDHPYICLGNGVIGGAGQGGCTITCDAIYSSLDSSGQRGGNLSITDACINLRGYNNGVLYGFNNVFNNGTGMAYSLPAGSSYDTGQKTLVNASNRVVTSEAKLGWKRYGVTVGGVDVHYKNFQNVKGRTISGTVSYDPSSKTLTLSNATVDITKGYEWPECIVNYGDELTVSVSGSCKLTRGTYSYGQSVKPVVRSSKNLTFQGSGSLTVEGYLDNAIQMTDGQQLTLTFQNVVGYKLNGKGIDLGGGTLKLSRSTVNVFAITNIGDLNMTGTELTDGLVWYPDEKKIHKWNSTSEPQNLKFQKVTTTYGISIANHELNDVNVGNFHYYNTEGTLTFDDGTITLNNFSGDALKKQNGMNVMANCPFDVVNVKLEGKNRLTNPNGIGVSISKETHFAGPGTLNTDNGIYSINGSSIVVQDGATIEADQLRSYGDNATLTFKRCHVKLRGIGGGYLTIGGFGTVLFTGADVTSPEGAYYDSTKGALVAADGTTIDGPVVVRSVVDYGITINGRRVTSKNSGDIDVYGKTQGQVFYDEDTHTLTFCNVEAETPSPSGLIAIYDGSGSGVLTISLVGRNHIKGSVNIEEPDDADGPLHQIIIEGEHPRASHSLACNRLSTNRPMKLKNCQLGATLLTSGTLPVGLEIINSHVMLSGTSGVATLSGFSPFTLTEAYVVDPENWAYGTGYKLDRCLYDGAGNYFIPIEIMPTGMVKGDANGDKSIDVADIAAIIDIMAGTLNPDTPTLGYADVNGDGTIDVADIAAIIDIMTEH